MKPNPIQLAILAGICSLAASTAQAQALAWKPSWSASGFGTLGWAKTNTDAGELVNPGQHGGANSKGSIGIDSLLGGQLNVAANSVFSGTFQAITERNGSGNFKPTVSIAFIKAQATPELALRVGRLPVTDFMVSDYRHVNYSNLWVRPPVDVYGQVPADFMNGADATYQTSIGGATITGNLGVGSAATVINKSAGKVFNELSWNVNVEFENGITLRAGRTTGKLTFSSPLFTTLLGGLQAFHDTTLYNQITGRKVSFTGFGASIDHDNFVGNVEYTQRRTETFIADTTGWAATAGYHLGKFTPYVVQSKLKVDDPNIVDNLPSTGPTARLRGGVEAVLRSARVGERTSSVGLRWDAYKNIAIKGQFDHITPDANSNGEFQSTTAAFGRPVNVYTASVDFVF